MGYTKMSLKSDDRLQRCEGIYRKEVTLTQKWREHTPCDGKSGCNVRVVMNLTRKYGRKWFSGWVDGLVLSYPQGTQHDLKLAEISCLNLQSSAIEKKISFVGFCIR
jgi:hypothetical protein